METRHLIVGLGNPGREYGATRHNAGFMLADLLAGRWRVGWSNEGRFSARVALAAVGGSRVVLGQPQTFMNASGESVGQLADFYKIEPVRILVAVDDADLPLGQIRMRPSGSSGGHHGLESVEAHLATREYPRLRIGIGRTVAGVRQITGHVLGRFAEGERVLLDAVLGRAADQAECWLTAGIGPAMNRFNGAVDRPGQEEKDTE